MRKGLLFVFFAFMFAGCAAHVGIPQEDHRLMKLVSVEATKYCDDALYSFNASLAAGIVPRPESFYGDVDYCLALLRQAEARAMELANKAATVSRKDHIKMNCYRDHFKAAIETWEDFRTCYVGWKGPSWILRCFQIPIRTFNALKTVIWEQCPEETDNNSSDDRRSGRSDP